MPLIRHGRLVEDPWVAAADDAELPVAEAVIVGLERWRAEREALVARNGRLGLRLSSDQLPESVADDLDHFDLVALEFPKFKDGRAYSSARLLRERYGFTGELRAVGEVLRDQLSFMQRCGFDAFEISDALALDGWREAFSEITVRFQPATDRRPWAATLRRRTDEVQPPVEACAGAWAY